MNYIQGENVLDVLNTTPVINKSVASDTSSKHKLWRFRITVKPLGINITNGGYITEKDAEIAALRTIIETAKGQL